MKTLMVNLFCAICAMLLISGCQPKLAESPYGTREQGWEEFIKAGILLPGWEKDIRTAIASMDLVVLPSHREGFPRTLVYACAMKKPIVTTDSRGCREAVENNVNGLLVPVGDAKKLEKAIKRMVDEEDFRKECGIKGRRRAEEQFDESQLVCRFVDAALDVIEEKG